jgi:uncharacterized protein
MERELGVELTYHSLSHTFDDVLPAAIRLTDLYHLGDLDLALVAVAAAYHDIGWVIQEKNHEAISAGIARQILPTFSFEQEHIESIAGMIMATRLPQSPNNLLEQIVADADLDVLGREDYWSRNDDLRAEMAALGHPRTDEEWNRHQLDFLQSHRYFTEAAILLRREQKQKHLTELKRLVTQFAQPDVID